MISCGARLAVFDIAELREVTSYDELELDTLGDRKTALFLIMSDTDDSFNFLISMCYTQLFNLLCEKADDVYGGRLPVHVRCLIDECANIGQIPKLEKLVATIRSREISACLVLQAQSQLKAIYKDNADTIIGNMDTSIFLGGKEPTTLKELAAVLGKETIDTYNTGESRGRETSHSLNYQKLGKELMSQDELAVMDGGKCILQLRGVRPFLSDKYDITRHPNFKYTADADKRNTFDIELELIHQKMQQCGTENLSAYLRKMALDGYVVKLELPELKELVSLMRRSSNNLNQLTRKVHETGRVYNADLEDISQRQEQLWEGVKEILTQLSKLS